jgi:glucose-6-phosphate 1-dehydrogenase
VRDEKVKVLRAVSATSRTIFSEMCFEHSTDQGGLEAKRYRVPVRRWSGPDSQTETFVAMKLYVDNWRWAGVPFYLRSGKRLPKRETEIAISFKRAPLALFSISMRTVLHRMCWPCVSSRTRVSR